MEPVQDSERVVIDVVRFKEAVWAVDRHNFRPGDALDALERAAVTEAGAERDLYREALYALLTYEARRIAREDLDG